MPSYWRLKFTERKAEQRRIIANLIALRDQVRAQIPQRTATGTLILGTWNIRNFDDDRFGYGPRLEESFWYLAEVLSCFDIIAVQELCDDLEPLEALMRLLDPAYDYIITDLTEGPSGNRERLGFIYDTRKVTFKGVAGEIVLPDTRLISERRQFARTPFSCTFQSGWFSFTFSTVHIYFGKESTGSDEYRRRVAEIREIASFLAKRASTYGKNHILVGDFNIEDYDGDTFDALAESGFEVVRNKLGSNAKRTRFYDQISFKIRPGELLYADPEHPERSRGIVDVFEHLFNAAAFTAYRPAVIANIERRIAVLQADMSDSERRIARARSEGSKATHRERITRLRASIAAYRAMKSDDEALREYYDTWRTYQLSDHLPLWVALQIDFSEQYLTRLASLPGDEPEGSILPN